MSIFLLLPTFALALPLGISTSYTSPNGVMEQCVVAQPMPEAVFTKKDLKAEADLCSIDLYRQEVAVCAKTWSTSPGTIFYATDGFGLSQTEFEAKRCDPNIRKENDKLAKFKNSMNQSGTSGTYSQSSLLYYQFSRYFQTLVQVPIAVYRSIDKDVHYERVAKNARGQGAMNEAGWDHLRKAERNPSSYKPVRDLFTEDLQQIYGVLLDDAGGERYGTEINGIRSSWGDGQNNDFQNTPAFRALRSEKPFAQAVAEGIASKSGKIASDLGTLPLPAAQMGLWMRELSEITLLDFLFNQQDRVGNIDFNWYWLYVENGEVKTKKEKREEYEDLSRKKMGTTSGVLPPAEIAPFSPILVQKSAINDNDAGGRTEYTNFTKRTKMLEKIRHYHAYTYRRLIALANDFQAQGTLFQHLAALDVTPAQIDRIVKNTMDAAAILQKSCVDGKLRFDLNFDNIVKGAVQEERVDCLRP